MLYFTEAFRGCAPTRARGYAGPSALRKKEIYLGVSQKADGSAYLKPLKVFSSTSVYSSFY